MGMNDVIAELRADYPDVGMVEPAHRWNRPATNTEILQRIDRSQIRELVFFVEVWDKETRRKRRQHQLTQDGAIEAACAMGGITTGQPVWSISDEEISCDVPASDHVTGVTVWGTAAAPTMITYTDRDGKEITRRNEHARATALGKAQRNAISNLIPADVAQTMFRWFEEAARGEQPPQERPNPAPKPEPHRRRRRDAYIPLLKECGDSAVLASTWKDVIRDGHEADLELMEIAFKLCKEFVSDTTTAQQWNQVVGDVKSIGFATDPEMQELIRLQKEKIQNAAGEDGGES